MYNGTSNVLYQLYARTGAQQLDALHTMNRIYHEQIITIIHRSYMSVRRA